MENSMSNEVTQNADAFCTPIQIDAGWILDPTMVVNSAKQVACSTQRNVQLNIETGELGKPYSVTYKLRYNHKDCLAEIIGVVVTPIPYNQ